MSDLIPFTPAADFATFRLEQTVHGHVLSPRFTFTLNAEERQEGAYSFGSRYHTLVRASKAAFADILSIPVSDVIVSEHRSIIEGGLKEELWWRLGTKHQCALPQPKKKQLPPDMQGAIEV